MLNIFEIEYMLLLKSRLVCNVHDELNIGGLFIRKPELALFVIIVQDL